MATIAVLGTFDTKGPEHAFVADGIREHGHDVLLIDAGIGTPQGITPDITNAQLASMVDADLAELDAVRDRGQAMATMARAAATCVRSLHEQKRIDGIISLGGSGGSAIASAAMLTLPIGVPKLLVSTMVAGNAAEYVGTRDITLMPSVVDVSGLNRISRKIFSRAAGAICGMVSCSVPESDDRPVIVASMFGNTTTCVNAAVPLLKQAGYEILIFHATGAGGRAMESLIDSGLVSGVLDITTTEWADELVGGILGAGPERLDAAARTAVPAVVVPGCLDMVNFGPPHSVPEKFSDRLFYEHNPQITLMRTTADECRELGRIVAEKVNRSRGPVTVLIPVRGISVISAAGQPFHDPAADEALFDSLESHLRPDLECRRLDCEINSPEFSSACAQVLLDNIAEAVRRS